MGTSFDDSSVLVDRSMSLLHVSSPQVTMASLVSIFDLKDIHWSVKLLEVSQGYPRILCHPSPLVVHVFFFLRFVFFNSAMHIALNVFLEESAGDPVVLLQLLHLVDQAVPRKQHLWRLLWGYLVQTQESGGQIQHLKSDLSGKGDICIKCIIYIPRVKRSVLLHPAYLLQGLQGHDVHFGKTTSDCQTDCRLF